MVNAQGWLDRTDRPVWYLTDYLCEAMGTITGSDLPRPRTLTHAAAELAVLVDELGEREGPVFCDPDKARRHWVTLSSSADKDGAP